MKNTLIVLALVFIWPALSGYGQRADNTLLFRQPATCFQESLPLGNGRLGALVGGQPVSDSMVLNEISLWSGGPQNADNDSAHVYLPAIQQLLMEGRNAEAQHMLQAHFVSRGKGSGFGNGKEVPYGCYQTLGRLIIHWSDSLSPYADYSRKLDLSSGLASSSWTREGVPYGQEVFASREADVIFIRLQAGTASGLNISVSLSRDENAILNTRSAIQEMTGQLSGSGGPGMRFAAILRVIPEGGHLSNAGNQIHISGASACVLIVSAATDYNRQDCRKPLGDPLVRASALCEAARKRPYAAWRADQVSSFGRLFNRCSFQLETGRNDTLKATPDRLRQYFNGQPDPQLPVLYFNFGRYLLISSSRPGELPANLQGLWAPEYQTPWNGDYHININLQMNYWLAEPAGLGDLAEPLFAFTRSLVAPGGRTARAYYAAPGWVAHVISNPWGFTSPGEGADWGSTLTGGAWLCSHIWEHYRFTHDTSFLNRYYPVMKGAADFLAAILIQEPRHGWLVTAPSNSPENAYRMPDGYVGQTCMGPTMDMEICRELFHAVAAAAKILNRDTASANRLLALRRQLAPLQVGAKGDINEWLDDWADADPHHRHVSQLYGLHPYDEITPWDSPGLAGAARETLRQRGDAGTGWSKAWKICFWARLGDGDHALQLIKQLLQPIIPGGAIHMDGGGTYPNLFCAHPPFQIDGNFGGTAGIFEMLLQSQGREEIIRPLPALPADPAWQTGSLQGFHTRGAFIIDFSWKKGKLVNGHIQSLKGGECRILLPPGFEIRNAYGQILAQAIQTSEPIRFLAQAGGTYSFGPSAK